MSSIKEQLNSLGNLPRFFGMIWDVSATLTLWHIVLRLIQSVIPLLMLYIGKEIIDGVVFAVTNTANTSKTMEIITEQGVWWWVIAECALGIGSSLLGRGITLSDSLLSDLVNNDSSVRIIRHAATLDLYQFEFANKLDSFTVPQPLLTSQTKPQNYLRPNNL
jgi:ATP-binding cassette, subfamily B, bacterial